MVSLASGNASGTHISPVPILKSRSKESADKNRVKSRRLNFSKETESESSPNIACIDVDPEFMGAVTREAEMALENVEMSSLNIDLKSVLRGNFDTDDLAVNAASIVDRRVRKKLASIRQYSREHKAIYVDKLVGGDKNRRLLRVSKNVTIKPHNMLAVPVHCSDGSLDDKLWTCWPV